MLPPKRNKRKQPELLQPAPQRSPTVLQRISSFIPAIPIRKPTPKARPFSAPILTKSIALRRDSALEKTDQFKPSGRTTRRGERQPDRLPPLIDIPKLLEDEKDPGPCPNDPDLYYSFPPMAKSRSSSLLCGLGEQPVRAASEVDRRGSRDSIRPCSRGSNPCAHLKIARMRPKSPTVGLQLPLSPLSTVSEATIVPASCFLGPRPVTLQKVGSEKLKAVEPRISISSSPNRPPTRHGPVPDVDRGTSPIQGLKNITPSISKLSCPQSFCAPTISPQPHFGLPESPKLHHLHCLPHAHSHPYVRKSEVEAHLANARAGVGPFAEVAPAIVEPKELSKKKLERTTRSGLSARERDLFSDAVYYPPDSVPGFQRKVRGPDDVAKEEKRRRRERADRGSRRSPHQGVAASRSPPPEMLRKPASAMVVSHDAGPLMSPFTGQSAVATAPPAAPGQPKGLQKQKEKSKKQLPQSEPRTSHLPPGLVRFSPVYTTPLPSRVDAQLTTATPEFATAPITATAAFVAANNAVEAEFVAKNERVNATNSVTVNTERRPLNVSLELERSGPYRRASPEGCSYTPTSNDQQKNEEDEREEEENTSLRTRLSYSEYTDSHWSTGTMPPTPSTRDRAMRGIRLRDGWEIDVFDRRPVPRPHLRGGICEEER